jgi:hypothetical protein
MKITGLDVDFAPLGAPVPIGFAQVTAAQWQTAAHAVRDAGGRLLALWASLAINPVAIAQAQQALRPYFAPM